MDDIMKRFGIVGMLALAGLSGVSAQGQGLPDPTRPAIGSGSDAAGTPLQLQVVLIGRGPAGRRVAVISGQTLRIGDKFDGAVLSAIADNEVVLRSGNKVRVLKLFPAPERRDGRPDGNVN